jgi:hypothetical protein
MLFWRNAFWGIEMENQRFARDRGGPTDQYVRGEDIKQGLIVVFFIMETLRRHPTNAVFMYASERDSTPRLKPTINNETKRR